MHWIRQHVGKALEWLGRIYSDASKTFYASTVQGLTEITRDNSNSMVYLSLPTDDPPEATGLCSVLQCRTHTVMKARTETLQKPKGVCFYIDLQGAVGDVNNDTEDSVSVYVKSV